MEDDVFPIDGDDKWTDSSNRSVESLLDIRDILSMEYFSLSLARTIFQLFICVFGALGNIVVLVICYQRKIKSSAMVYVGAIAIVDLFTCSVVIPLQIRNTLRYYNHDNVYTCKIYEWFKMSTLASSCLLFMAVAVDRYQAICYPFAWRRGGTRRSCLVAVSCILLGMACMAPELHMIGLQDYSLNETVGRFDFPPEFLATVDLNLTCHVCEHLNKFDDSLEIILFLCIALFIYALLAAVCVILYGKIAWVMAANKKKATSLGLGMPQNRVYVGKTNIRPSNTFNSSAFKSEEDGRAEQLNDQSREAKKPNQEQSNHPELAPMVHGLQLNSDRKQNPSPKVITRPDSRLCSVSKSLMVTTVVFIVTWIPHWVVNVYSLWAHGFLIKATISVTAFTDFFEQLFFLNNAVNPLVYLIFSRDFRLQCKKLLKLRFGPKQNHV